MIRQHAAFALFVTLLTLVASRAECQKQFILKKDLQSDWLVYQSPSYVAFAESKDRVNTIYFQLNTRDHKGDYLRLTSGHDFAVMVNSKLIFNQKKITVLPIDSLATLFPTTTLFFSIHQEHEISETRLVTQVGAWISQDQATNKNVLSLRSNTFFHDFVITAVLVLLIFLICMIHLNPRLSSDYFSVAKIFSLRDSEDEQFYYRLTSGNILFYVFTSMVLACYMIIISQFIETGLGSLKIEGYLSSVFAWLKISMVIFVLVIIKMFVIYSITSLFNVRDIAGFHLFNFIRLLLVFTGVLTLVLGAYYVLLGQQKGVYNFLYDILMWILGGWVVLLFLKLSKRVQYSVFHIFSYICATEIIPFLLIVKVLNE
jgi:hypothetical protein